MATRVRLTADVDPEVKKQVRIAAIQSETSVSEWVEQAVIRELERNQRSATEVENEGVYLPPAGAKPRGSISPIKLRGGKSMAEAVSEGRGSLDDFDIVEPPPGEKPSGSKHPVRLRGGMTVSDAVIEDRR